MISETVCLFGPDIAADLILSADRILGAGLLRLFIDRIPCYADDPAAADLDLAVVEISVGSGFFRLGIIDTVVKAQKRVIINLIRNI